MSDAIFLASCKIEAGSHVSVLPDGTVGLDGDFAIGESETSADRGEPVGVLFFQFPFPWPFPHGAVLSGPVIREMLQGWAREIWRNSLIESLEKISELHERRHGKGLSRDPYYDRFQIIGSVRDDLAVCESGGFLAAQDYGDSVVAFFLLVGGPIHGQVVRSGFGGRPGKTEVLHACIFREEGRYMTDESYQGDSDYAYWESG